MVIINPELVEPLRGLAGPMTRGFAFLAAATATSPKTRSHYHSPPYISNPPVCRPLSLLVFLDTVRAFTGFAGL